MRRAYDADAVRAAEQPLLAVVPEGALMMRAATALARRCAELLGTTYGARVVLLVGGGNNGGDALHAGALLARRGARVDALLATESPHAAGAEALWRAGGRLRASGGDNDAAAVAAADLVVDGLVGIGATGVLREPHARLAALTEGCDATVVAVDVPSGVDASTGEVAGTSVRADVTVTFGAVKPGLVVAPGAHRAGVVEVVDLGLDLPGRATVEVLDAVDVAGMLPRPAAETDKYHRGVLGVVAGSDQYTGAAVMAVGGALHTGVGMVRFAGAAHAAELVRQRWPEVVVTVVEPGDGGGVLDAGRVQAWVVGSGLGTGDDAEAMVRAVLSADVPVLVDADALTVLHEHPELIRERSAPTVLTPHAGEFARLRDADRDDVEARRLAHVTAAAADLGVTVLLKGSTTLVATAGAVTRANPTGTAWLGTAGSGDVLTGACGALLAGGLRGHDAASVGAFLHGLAARLATGSPAVSVTAMDLVSTLPAAVRAVRG